MAHEYKAFKFTLDTVDEDGTFAGHAAVFGNLDGGGDIVEEGAFAETIKEDFDRVKILFMHNEYELPLGKPLELREDAKGLFIKGKISDTQKGRDILILMRDRVLNEMSIGYDPIDFDIDADTEKGESIRHLHKVRLWEVSIVTWGMNDLARIDEVKSMTQQAESLTDILKNEMREGKMSRSRLKALSPFIAVVRELADIIEPLLETSEPDKQPPDQIDTKQQNKDTKQTKNAGMVFKIIPTNTRR